MQHLTFKDAVCTLSVINDFSHEPTCLTFPFGYFICRACLSKLVVAVLENIKEHIAFPC